MSDLRVANPALREHLADLIADLNTETFMTHPFCIAGGAVRDMLLGGEHRDIDLYVLIDNYTAVLKYLMQTDEFDESIEYINSFRGRGSDEYDHQYINAQIEVETPQYGLVNVIALRNDTEIQATAAALYVIDLFNIGVNMVAIDTQNRLVFNEYAMRDYKNGTATVLRANWGLEGTEKCVNKLLKKYPNMDPVFPDGSHWSLREAQERY